LITRFRVQFKGLNFREVTNILLARSLYKDVDGELMIQFIVYTKTQLVRNPPITFPSIIYKLTEFSDIPNVIGRTENFIGNYRIYTYHRRYTSI
jgi:hypothetical protein